VFLKISGDTVVCRFKRFVTTFVVIFVYSFLFFAVGQNRLALESSYVNFDVV
jgi:hypothetical protein